VNEYILTVIAESGYTEYIQSFTGKIYEHKQPLPDINSAVYAVGGSYTDNQGFCIIPDDEKNRMMFIRFFEDKSSTELEQPFIGLDMYISNLNYVVPFSSGDYFISLARTSRSSDMMLNFCSLYDASTLAKVKDILFESDSYLDISAFSADERKIIFSNFYYDLDNDINTHLDMFAETEQAPRLSDGLSGDSDLSSYFFRSSPMSAQKAGQPVYTSYFDWPEQTLYMWKDTENIVLEQYPHEAEFHCSYNPNDDNDVWLVGQSGVAAGLAYIKSSDQRPDRYCAYSAEDRSWYSVENLCTADGFPAFAVGNRDKIIASADSDGKIRIYDVAKESLIREIAPQVSIASVMSLEFILSDSVLAAQLSNGNIAFIDAADGTVLGQFTVENIRSTDNAIIYENAAEKEIYLCDSKGYGTALCIDTDMWTTKYAIDGCLFILPETDTAICFDANRNLIARHVYTADESISMGNLLTADGNMPEE